MKEHLEKTLKWCRETRQKTWNPFYTRELAFEIKILEIIIHAINFGLLEKKE